MSEETILIVDDDPPVRNMLSEFLTDRKYHVLLAESGEQALKLLKPGSVHVALVDLKLPGMDGIETVRAIKEKDADVLIIVITSYPSTQSAVRALRYHVYDYLVKPFELAGLDRMIRKAMEDQKVRPGNDDLRKRIYDISRHLQRRIEELSFIRKIGADIESKTTELDEILRTILTGLTAGEALGFNRAFLFLMNEERNVLEGVMAVGPADEEEAHRVWRALSERHLSLREIVDARKEGTGDRILTDLIRKLKVPIEQEHMLTRAIKERTVLNVTEANIRQFGGTFPKEREADRFVAVPLLVKEGPVGVLVADNLFTHRAITDQDVQILETFANQASVAIENTRLSIQLEENVRELASAHRELQENQERLVTAERLAAVGEMAASIIHEIKTPLVSIGGFARLIRKTLPGSDPNLEYLTIISEEVSRLERVIENLLILAKPGRPEVKPDSINEVVEKALLLVTEKAEGAHIEINTSLDLNMPTVQFDRNQLRQVLLNLLQNALHAMPDGGTLNVTTRQKEAFVQVVVQDTGVGIPDEHLDRLFVPFFTTKPSGAGLGLSITHKILENHNGFIEVTSQEGVGTTFVVNLPLG